jgi:hypothetical protein
MSIAELFHAVQETGWATALRESDVVYPVVLSLHLSAIAFFGGLILLTNLHLLGYSLLGDTVANVVRQLRTWKWVGLTIMVTSGLLLASARADYYYPNTYFRIKLILLALIGVHAAVFRRRVYGKRSVPVPRTARLAACRSLARWIAILSMGRWIAYFERAKPAVTEIGR